MNDNSLNGSEFYIDDYGNDSDYISDEAYTESYSDDTYFEDDNYGEEAYMETSNESVDELSFRPRGVVRRPPVRRPSLQSRMQKEIRKLQIEIGRIRNQLRRGNPASYKKMIDKLNALEASLEKTNNSQVMSALLGLPKLSEITFDDSTLGRKEITNTEYEFPLLPLLLNGGLTGGSGKDQSMEQLLPLILLSQGNRGGNNSLLMLLLFSNFFNQKK